MKKKILSLVMCICVCFGALFSFSGCSLIKDNNTSANEQVVVSVNGTDFNKSDVVGSFYSFLYQNYSLIYNGTASSVIEEKFYNSFVKDQIVMQKAEEALEAGSIKYCEKDEVDVWEDVQDYFRSQIDSYEKDLYDNDESKYPVWLQTKNNEEDDELYNPYKDPSIKENEDRGAEAEKLSREDIEAEDAGGNSKYKDVFAAMFNYISSTTKDDNGGEERTYAEIKDQEGSETRRTAYAKYVQNLFLNAKAEGRVATEKELLLDEIEKVYESYYESKIAEIFQKYCEEVLVLDSTELTEDSIVKLFVEAMTADKQNFLNEADYVSVITGDDTEVILYHNNDKFFTVQHILLKFDDALVNLIKEDPFYVDMSSKDLQLEVYEQFVQNREEIVENYYIDGVGAITDVNEKQAEKMPSIMIDGFYGYYTYSEAEGYKVATSETEGAKKMATAEQIINCYNLNFTNIMAAVDTVLDDETQLDSQNEDIKHILEAALTMKKAGATDAEIETKVSSLVFIELGWIFSDDGLYNTIYKELGYVMANYPDENNNFSHEFVDKSKELYNLIANGTIDITEVTDASTIITKDGVHIIKVDNIFKQGTSLIDISGLTETADIAKLMKETYICNGSTQTVYDYYRDLVYTYLAGDEVTTGAYFENLKNEWLKEYLEDDKISYENKLSYEEIMSELY